MLLGYARNKWRAGGRLAGFLKTVAIFGMGAFLALSFLLPFLWMVTTSLKTNPEIFAATDPAAMFFPETPQLQNYRDLFTRVPFLRYLGNSLGVATGSALLETLVAAMAAFGLTVLRFRAQRFIRGFLFLSWLVPFSMVLVPRFLLFAVLPGRIWPGDFLTAQRVVGWGEGAISVGRLVGLDSFFALIVPGSVSITATFLLITAINRISPQLLETASLEAPSVFKVFMDIVLPLIRPSLITVGFMAFLSSWQSFTWPLLITTSLDMQTATIGLRAFQTLHATQWQFLMAGSVLLTLPSLLFLWGIQHHVVDRYHLSEVNDHRL